MNRIPNIVVDLLRSRGVAVVVETGAWERGPDFATGIVGFMNHHWGSSAAASGAVQAGHCYPKSQGGLRTDERINCNWFSDRDGTLHLIAAGASNYSSCYGNRQVLKEMRDGTWPGGTARDRGLFDISVCGNRFFVNMEAEHPGDGSPMPDIQELAIAHLNAAMSETTGLDLETNHIGHSEWTHRKIDPRWEGPGNRMPAIREEARNILNGGPATPLPPQEVDTMKMPPTIRYGDGGWDRVPADAPAGRNDPVTTFYVGNMQGLLTLRGFIDEKSEDDGAFPVDTKFGRGTESALKGFQTSASIAADGVCGPLSWTALIHAD